MMRRAVEIGKFKGYQVNNNIQFQILQFADDTILMGEDSWNNLWTIKTLLRGFELVSGLKINFVKSKLYGLNVNDRLLAAGSSFLSCRSDCIPFKFLGIPVGANPRRRETWKSVVDAMSNRLSTWTSRHLSYGGRITLINSEQGGLGVKNLELFNMALLSKWKWRFLNDSEAVWAELLRYRYGHLPTQLLGRETISNATSTSIWWRDVVGVGRDGETDWFKTHVCGKVGDGNNIGFWKFKWYGNHSFSTLFPDLFAKEVHPNVVIAERFVRSGDTFSWAWQWLDHLSVNEQLQVEQLMDLLLDFSLQPNSSDKWCWVPGVFGLFSVKSCYNILLANRQGVDLDPDMLNAIRKLWLNDIPSKVAVFGWRLLQERLPTRLALHNRNILLNVQDLACGLCSLSIEDCAHLFFSCPFSRSVWEAMSSWIGKRIPTVVTGYQHFLSFGALSKMNKGACVSHLIWLAITWNIWKLRNNTVFNGTIPSVSSIVDDIKVISWVWFNGRFGHKTCFSFFNWCIDPYACFQSSI
ncbi:putative non-LTR retroelement reverse transcriptase [Trifolium medium]|uniref:Putative non-LTR retroelement reverse transcriptase n=1 Tax=Trifolium medium TaxID=97028 RepID=A0A392LWZ5_9FABA|nr:putative non-LTR retroelement reverse transcriptase [Trifolium medium]